jgi:hypothetical protein
MSVGEDPSVCCATLDGDAESDGFAGGTDAELHGSWNRRLNWAALNAAEA